MEILDQIRWFSDRNKLSASLMRFHASIHVHKANDEIIFQVTVHDSNMDKLIMSFSTLEEAFTFVQSTVKNSTSLQQIADTCREVYNGKAPKIKKRKIPKEQ